MCLCLSISASQLQPRFGLAWRGGRSCRGKPLVKKLKGDQLECITCSHCSTLLLTEYPMELQMTVATLPAMLASHVMRLGQPLPQSIHSKALEILGDHLMLPLARCIGVWNIL